MADRAGLGAPYDRARRLIFWAREKRSIIEGTILLAGGQGLDHMTARQALAATYAYLCGLIGDDKADALLAGAEALTTSPSGRIVATDNRTALEGLRIVRPG